MRLHIQSIVKKPVKVEAVLLTVDNLEEVEKWCRGSIRGICLPPEQRVIAIQTLEGEMRASVGDYVIKGVKGEFYPIKPDILAETYEMARAAEKVRTIKVHESTDEPPVAGKELNFILDDDDLPPHVHNVRSIAEHMVAAVQNLADGEEYTVTIKRKDMTPAELTALPEI